MDEIRGDDFGYSGETKGINYFTPKKAIVVKKTNTITKRGNSKRSQFRTQRLESYEIW